MDGTECSSVYWASADSKDLRRDRGKQGKRDERRERVELKLNAPSSFFPPSFPRPTTFSFDRDLRLCPNTPFLLSLSLAFSLF